MEKKQAERERTQLTKDRWNQNEHLLVLFFCFVTNIGNLRLCEIDIENVMPRIISCY